MGRRLLLRWSNNDCTVKQDVVARLLRNRWSGKYDKFGLHTD